MKKLSLLLLLTFVFLSGQSQNREYFKNLKEFKYGVYALPTSEVIDTTFDWGDWMETVALVQVYPNQKDEIVIAFSEGPSADPYFIFLKKEGNNYTELSDVDGDEIYIPGNGYLYVKRRSNADFTMHFKYRFTSTGEIKEVAQPYYYVGLKTKTLKFIQLYSDIECTRKLAALPADSNIEVLIAAEFKDGTCHKYLIKTPFGLVGWWELDTDYPASKEIEGISFAGD